MNKKLYSEVSIPMMQWWKNTNSDEGILYSNYWLHFELRIPMNQWL